MREPYIKKTAQAARPKPKTAEPKNVNVSVKKIQNGYIVHHTALTPKGKYVEKMTYSPTNPIQINKVKFGK